MAIVKKVTNNLEKIRYHQKINDRSKLNYDIRSFFELFSSYRPNSSEEKVYYQLKDVADNFTKNYPDRFKPSDDHLKSILNKIINVYQFVIFSSQGKVGTQLLSIHGKNRQQIDELASKATAKLDAAGKKVILVNVGKSQMVRGNSLIINYIDKKDDK